MKHFLCFSLIIVGLLSISSCGAEKAPPTVTSEAPKITDTSLFFVRRILNCSPKEVEKVLGKADKGVHVSNDCGGELPSCSEATYKAGKFDILYYKLKI